jgi:hypothetical protein
VRNAVDGMTLGYGDKIAAGLDALTGRSPDYASALDAERAQSAQAMAQSPGGVGTAEQIAGMALPAGAIGRGAALIGDAAGALPFVGRLAASPLAKPRRRAQRSAGSMRPEMTKTSRQAQS